jgi:Mrp family chromosome partitioning ATPase/capsular polysaccharide biosynthesis protein
MAEFERERQETVRLEDYLRIARGRLWIIILAVVIVVAIAVGMSLATTPLYSSSAELSYQRNDLAAAVSGVGLSYDYDRDRTIASLVAVINRDSSLAEAVWTQLEAKGGTDREAASLAGMVNVGTTDGSDLVSIRAVSTDSAEAADVANAFAEQFVIYRRNADRAAVTGALAAVEEQIVKLTEVEKTTEYGLLLQQNYENLRILESMQDGGFRVISRASEPGAPYTPQTKRNIVLALIAGLVVGVGLAFLIEYLDKRINDERTLERAIGLPVLASVPAVGGRWHSSKGGKRSAAAVGFEGPRSVMLESFRTLRSSLQYFDAEGTMHTLLITSGLAQEGKTVTTVDLAISLALSGKRVILLEADLRRPMLHEYLSLENKVGLSGVLSGQASVSDALQLVLMEAFIPSKAHRERGESREAVLEKNLYCMTAGPVPPNPAELLGSARMAYVVSELKHMADYLLIDTPPVLPVSDAFTLAPQSDAVILVARLHSSTREEMEETRNLLNRAGVRAIGVVATGVKPKSRLYRGRGYNYGYGYQ